MSHGELDLFIKNAIAVCAVMTLISLARYKKRGLSAVLLGFAFAVFGIGLQLYRTGASTPILALLGVIFFASLVGDIVIRTSKTYGSGEPR